MAPLYIPPAHQLPCVMSLRLSGAAANANAVAPEIHLLAKAAEQLSGVVLPVEAAAGASADL